MDRPKSDAIPVVLHVEDNPDSRTLMAKLCARVDQFVALINAGTGSDALALLDACVPDLVLLDLDLPDMDGREILEAIRASTRTADVRVVIVSGHSQPEVIRELLTLGANDYLTKPFEIADVIALLSSLVDETHARPR